MAHNSIWRDIREIKFRYLMLVGICLIGGGVVRSNLGIDHDDYEDDFEHPLKHEYRNAEDRGLSIELDLDLDDVGLDSGEIDLDSLDSEEIVSRLEQFFDEEFNDEEKKDLLALRDLGSLLTDTKIVQKDWRARQARNANYLFSLTDEKSRNEVEAELGEADFIEFFDNDIVLLMYRVRELRSDFLTTKNETAVLVFQQDKLIGFDDSGDWFGGERIKMLEADFAVIEEKNRREIDELTNGMDRSGLIEKLGRPDFIDYPAADMEIISYRTQTVLRMGFTSRDEVTALLLKDGKLIAKSLGIEKLEKIEQLVDSLK